MWSRDHYVSPYYSKYLKQEEKKRREKVEIAARPHTIIELEQARPGFEKGGGSI